MSKEVAVGIYDMGGRAYEWLILSLTCGLEERFKGEAIARLGIEPGQRVLDWGCGTGLSTGLIVPHLKGRGEIFCVDISPTMMKLAVQKARLEPELAFHFTLRQGFDLELSRPADVALASYSLGVLRPDQFDAAVREIWRNTAPGAKLLVIDMYIPEARSLTARLYQRANRFVSTRVFRQDFSQTLLPAIAPCFDTVEVQREPGLMAFAFIGTRREEPTLG